MFFKQALFESSGTFLASSSTDSCDAKSITDVSFPELAKVGLTLSKILIQVYDGASIMAGHCGGVQRLLQKSENRKIPYVHYQLRLVVVQAMSVEQAINDFLHVFGSLYNFFRKPAVALYYYGEKLKCLLKQRWTGHLATVTAVLNFFQHVKSLLQEMGTSRAHKPETHIKASGLLQDMQEQSFLFIATMLYKVCITITSF